MQHMPASDETRVPFWNFTEYNSNYSLLGHIVQKPCGESAGSKAGITTREVASGDLP